jgi:hypothetical protein
MSKTIAIWFVLVMLSPFIVLIGAEHYVVIGGWGTIGHYNFDIYDGLQRSLYYFIITVPVIIALYLGRPKVNTSDEVKLIVRTSIIKKRHIILMMLFCFVAFYFNLGITGVETDTGGLRLSGIAYYIRNYLFLVIIAIYIFSSNKISFVLILVYSLIVGVTASSRLGGVSPLVLLLIRHFYDKKGGVLDFRCILILFSILMIFSIVTFSRNIIYVDGYSFDRLWGLINTFDYSKTEFIYQGVRQLFLRVGIGRDVILSYEIGNMGVCTDMRGLFLKSGSCLNPPMDFYGLFLDTNKFYLAPPMLSSLFVISNNFIIKLAVAICYSMLVYFMCSVAKLIQSIPFGKLFGYPLFLLLIVFVTIGPIYFAWLLVCGVVAVVSMYYLIFLSCGLMAKTGKY